MCMNGIRGDVGKEPGATVGPAWGRERTLCGGERRLTGELGGAGSQNQTGRESVGTWMDIRRKLRVGHRPHPQGVTTGSVWRMCGRRGALALARALPETSPQSLFPKELSGYALRTGGRAQGPVASCT